MDALTAAPRRLGALPHPPSWPLVGSLPYFDPPRVHLVLEEWARRYGTPYRVNLAKRWMLVIDDPAEIARILRARPGAFRRVRPVESIFRELGIAGLFSSEGADWERQRRLVMKAFDPAHLKRYFPGLVMVTRRLLARFQRAARSGEVLDLQLEFMRYTVDVTAGLAFGVDINTIEQGDNAIQRHLDKVFPSINRRMSAIFPWWRYVRLPGDVALEKDLAEVRRAIDGFIAAARARIAADPALALQPGNLIEALLVAREAPQSGFSDADVSGNVFTVLLAGEDTTANTLAWLTAFLADEKAAQAAAQAEADAVLGEHSVLDAFDRVDDLVYTEAATREAMRLKPVAPILSHESNEPVTVCGIALRARTPIATLMRPAGLDPERFPQPMSFRPERWLGDAGKSEAAAAAKRVLMPFGGGPRFCPGRYLAMLEIQMVTSMMMRNFIIERVGSEPVRERNALSMLPEGFRARLTPR
ncbi:MAG: cytochrome P450 [Burkholderiales bacterium]|nr:cytochrome P450 [Burkholderiales bacterium]